MKCIAIDDETLALELIRSYVNKIPFLELCGTFTDPFEAMNFLSRNKTDLIFTDIEMADINGVQLISSLQYKPMVIFITAYERYAIDGFMLDAVDYILKPVNFERFLKGVNKAHDLLNKTNNTPPGASVPVVVKPIHAPDHIFVKTENKLVKVMLSDILYIEGYGDYVKIHIRDGRTIVTLNNMSALEEKLPEDNFIRVHRSFIVAIDKIDEVERRRIKIGRELIPVSDSYAEAFVNKLDQTSL
ncbi:MAG: LytTR family DNA-binding domain-containing protein [Rikenellaceae bacterium]|nr:LytTR family DNA-binding domain-containing protein [Rikenellaceae bacterium]